MFNKKPTIVVDKYAKTVHFFSSENDAFERSGIKRSTGQRYLNTGRALYNRYYIYHFQKDNK